MPFQPIEGGNRLKGLNHHNTLWQYNQVNKLFPLSQ